METGCTITATDCETMEKVKRESTTATMDAHFKAGRSRMRAHQQGKKRPHMRSPYEQFSRSRTCNVPVVRLPGGLRPKPAQHRKRMWQDVVDDVIQLRFAASSSTARQNPEINGTYFTQFRKRLRRFLGARLECHLMDRA